MIVTKLIFLEFASRVGSMLLFVGFWNLILLMIGDESYFRSIVCMCFGLLLWAITENLEIKSQSIIK